MTSLSTSQQGLVVSSMVLDASVAGLSVLPPSEAAMPAAAPCFSHAAASDETGNIFSHTQAPSSCGDRSVAEV